jgi:hypothetical protein
MRALLWIYHCLIFIVPGNFIVFDGREYRLPLSWWRGFTIANDVSHGYGTGFNLCKGTGPALRFYDLLWVVYFLIQGQLL